MRTLFRDLAHSSRLLLSRPGFTIIVVLTLGLGIGVNSAIFGLYDAVILRPLPVKDVDRMNRIQKSLKDGLHSQFSYPEYLALTEQNQVFSSLIAQSWGSVSLCRESTGQVEQVSALSVSPSYFPAMTSQFHMGRNFTENANTQTPSEPEVIVSYGFWQRHFSGEPGVMGESVLLNEHPFTVIGVCSENFRGFNLHTPDVFVPLSAQALLKPAQFAEDDGWIALFGVLAPGVSIPKAEAQLTRIALNLQEGTGLDRTPWKAALTSAQDSGPAAFEVIILMSAVGLVLLLACANVSNLILAQSNSRRREFAVRASLGASRVCLVRLCLSESLLLGLLSGGLGILIGQWMASSLIAVTEVLPNAVITVDWRILVHALVLCLVTVMLCGLSPALRGTQLDISQVLKEEGVTAGTGARTRRNFLIASQVAASLALLIVAGLFLKSLFNARYADSGINTDGVIQLTVDLRSEGKAKDPRVPALHRELIARLKALPGSQAVSYSIGVPGGNGSGTEQAAANLRVSANRVSADYFRVLGMHLLMGRAFTEREVETGSNTAVISHSLAVRLWPRGNPIGQFLDRSGGAERAEVIGVVKETVWDRPKMCIYLPITESQKGESSILIRVSGDTVPLMGMIRRSVLSVQEDVQPEISLLQKQLDASLRGSWADAMVWTTLAAISLLLATVGIYGVVSYATSQRTREVGIRMALGASPGEILRLVLVGGFRPVLAGSLVGIVLAGLASRFFMTRLHGLSPLDPTVFVGVSVFLVMVAMASACLPARRAARIDPLTALRSN